VYTFTVSKYPSSQRGQCISFSVVFTHLPPATTCHSTYIVSKLHGDITNLNNICAAMLLYTTGGSRNWFHQVLCVPNLKLAPLKKALTVEAR
jgi:hypothetical protein